MSDHKIINARIVTPDRIIRGYLVYSHNGKILSVGEGKGPETEEVLDAQGAWLVPGGIDPHVHLGGFGEIPIADDFYHGSLGALAGGTTTVIDFCEPEAGESSLHCIAKRKKEAEQSAVDYAFHFVLTEAYKKQLEDLEDILKEGIRNFKLFTIYPNTTLKKEDFREIWQYFSGKKQDFTFLVHAEAAEEIEKRKEQVKDRKDVFQLAQTRPGRSETDTVKWLREIQRQYGEKVCIAHVSAGKTVELAEKDSAFTMETCPHYLMFTEEKLKGPLGALYTMTPPLRKKSDVEELWKGIFDGRISMLSTDHCPYHRRNKLGKSFDEIPCGVDGIQLRMLFLYSEGVVKRGLSMEEYVRLTAENAARFYGLYPEKGCLAPGSDADLVLINEEETTEITNGYCKSSLDYSIYDGMRFQGKISMVLKGGKIVYNGENVMASRGSGCYLGV